MTQFYLRVYREKKYQRVRAATGQVIWSRAAAFRVVSAARVSCDDNDDDF
jgi:hypothetical protein